MTDYADASEFKSFLRITEESPADTTDDAEIALALASASREIDQHCNRTFGPPAESAVARYYTAHWDRERAKYYVDIHDLMTSTSLAVDLDILDDQTWSESVTVADCRLYPLNAAADGKPWTRLYLPTTAPLAGADGAVRVTAKYGWTAIPDEVKQACLLQASRNLKRRDAPLGVAGSPDMGNELRLLQKLDVDVAVLLRSVIRWWGAQ